MDCPQQFTVFVKNPLIAHCEQQERDSPLAPSCRTASVLQNEILCSHINSEINELFDVTKDAFEMLRFLNNFCLKDASEFLFDYDLK